LNTRSTLGNTFSSGFGVRLVNNTGSFVTSFSVSYIGEQWSRGANASQATDKLTFSYQIFDSGTGSLASTGWISVSSLDFTSPNASISSVANLDGNLPENQTSVFNSVTGISLAEGQELWLRWVAVDTLSFNDHHLAIDDLTVTFGAIPEPATSAVCIGIGAALLAGFRRRYRVGT
jgi:hypothetical protein